MCHLHYWKYYFFCEMSSSFHAKKKHELTFFHAKNSHWRRNFRREKSWSDGKKCLFLPFNPTKLYSCTISGLPFQLAWRTWEPRYHQSQGWQRDQPDKAAASLDPIPSRVPPRYHSRPSIPWNPDLFWAGRIIDVDILKHPTSSVQ